MPSEAPAHHCGDDEDCQQPQCLDARLDDKGAILGGRQLSDEHEVASVWRDRGTARQGNVAERLEYGVVISARLSNQAVYFEAQPFGMSPQRRRCMARDFPTPLI